MKKSFLKKVSFIFCLAAFLLILDACHGSNCNCPEITKHFFDFQSTNLDVRRHSIDIPQNNIPNGAVANIYIELEDIEFLVDAKTETPACRRPWFINSAFACSCIEEGNEGLKFAVTDIRVFSDADYSDEISAGELLNDIITVNRPESVEQGPLSSVEDKNKMFYTYGQIHLSFETPPSVDSTHTITVEIEKENGTTIISETMPITWLE